MFEINLANNDVFLHSLHSTISDPCNLVHRKYAVPAGVVANLGSEFWHLFFKDTRLRPGDRRLQFQVEAQSLASGANNSIGHNLS